ncbi:E2 ligase fold family C protein [Sphingomonas aerolata]|uniref:E2 ligase fold family C protein n=1 Tax=Sphingomonas aerolata TaxID=185951 RepID=UPI002FE35DBF
MGFAPFFDRARQSVGQALRGVGLADLERRLEGVIVTIAFDATAEGSLEARRTLDLSARLAARLYPNMRILPLHRGSDLADELTRLVKAINPAITLANGQPHGLREVALVVGSTRHQANVVVYAGSEGWIAKVSTSGPVGSVNSGNPFGAGAAACLGMANVFRAVFADLLPHAGLDDDAALSLLNFETGTRAANLDLGASVDIAAVQLVGVGAVGNAFLWSIARVPGIVGTLHPVDHETVELSNLQRYVLTTMADDEAVKITLAKRELAGSRLKVVPSRGTWSDHVGRSAGARYDLVAVALDSARDRILVQSSLPRRIVNAWTQDGDLGISRHGFDGEQACLACLYLPHGKRRSLDEIVAGELGLDHETYKMRLRDMLVVSSPVGEAFAREVAAAGGHDPAPLMAHAGLPLRAFRQRAVCGGLVMRAGDGSGADVEVPLAFQSALAGVMLAAEVVAERTGIREVRPATRSVVDLLRPLTSRPTFNVLKRASVAVRCICEDPDWQDAYRVKWLLPQDENSDRHQPTSNDPLISKRARRRNTGRTTRGKLSTLQN